MEINNKRKTLSFILDEKRITELRLFAVKNNIRGVAPLIELMINKFIDENGILDENKLNKFLND